MTSPFQHHLVTRRPVLTTTYREGPSSSNRPPPGIRRRGAPLRSSYVDAGVPAVEASPRASGPSLSGRLPAIVVICLATAACDTTSIAGLNVRAEPTTDSAVVASIDRVDTHIGIDCFVYGEPVHGDPVWYRIDRPHSGYVTNYYVDTGGDGLAGTLSC